jgi:iron only hydrogenase large subunit-like protein
MAIKPPNNWRTTIEPLTKQELETALEMLDITFENDPNWQTMSRTGKEIFASALIRSFDLLKQ